MTGAGRAAPLILDLGCGKNKKQGSIGADRFLKPRTQADVVLNADRLPLPFKDSSFDAIVMNSVLEHVEDVPATLEECHRILAAGGLLEILVPHFASVDAFTDVTHKHFFGLHSLDYFCDEFEIDFYTVRKFRKLQVELSFWPLHDRLPWLVPSRLLGICWLARRHPTFYERFLAFWFPPKEIRFVLAKP